MWGNIEIHTDTHTHTHAHTHMHACADRTTCFFLTTLLEDGQVAIFFFSKMSNWRSRNPPEYGYPRKDQIISTHTRNLFSSLKIKSSV